MKKKSCYPFGICLKNLRSKALLQYRHGLRTCISGCSRKLNMKRREIDMRLFCLEVKRIMKSRRTIILLTAALLLAVIMAYLPISFESINRPGDNGSVVELNGMEAIQFKREYRQDTMSRRS